MTRHAASYTQAELSAKFGKSDPRWFRRHKAWLIENANFPPAIPSPGHPIWSKRQVDRWFATGGETYVPAGEERQTITIKLDPLAGDELVADKLKALEEEAA